MKKYRLRTGIFNIFAILILFTIVSAKQALAAGASDYAIGADLSFLKAAEDNGVKFKDNGEAKHGLQIFKDHGYNWIRLRLFHNPANSRWPLPNNLEYTIASAKQAQERGYKFLLDFHYSDTWADPARQMVPEAWKDYSHKQLVDAVFEYTRDCIIAFREAGVLPDMVQIGNEVINGMLWPDGKLPEKWDNFAELVEAGISGVKEGGGESSRPKIMIQIEKVGDLEATKYFFDNLFARGVNCDVLGQSYYPWWHGSLLDMRDVLHFMAREYKKNIMLVEVAYCWRSTEYKDKPAPFPETPEGQRDFLDAVQQIMLSIPDGRGKGIFWWEPAVMPRPGGGGLRNRGMFDDDGNALPVIQVFDKYTRW
ncbi:glycosyl hydrolase 53 family protein [candidate division KSB1 bacterium]|nr:glycosyl hydrolase 53 family protein [candidate division KSB1 bacterium]